MEDKKKTEIITKLKKLQQAAFHNRNEEARFAYQMAIRTIEETR